MTDRGPDTRAEDETTILETPIWLTASEEDFTSVDLNMPVTDSSSVDVSEVGVLYENAANKAEVEGRNAERRAYSMIGALCSFYLKADELNEPFGVLFQDGNSRTALPEDFRGAPEKLLEKHGLAFRNSALRARVHDTLWLLNKSRVQSAQTALQGYIDVVRAVRDKTVKEDVHPIFCAEHLRRALQIANALGRDKEKSVNARELTARLRARAYREERVPEFCLMSELDFDFRISEPKNVATEAESLAQRQLAFHDQHRLWHLAARGYSLDKAEEEKNRCLTHAAEALVKVAEAGKGSAIYESHWLETAIAELGNVPGSRERRRELKHRLIDVQSNIFDEMKPFSQEADISEMVTAAQSAVSGKPFIVALANFARMMSSPNVEDLHERAVEMIAKFPLSGLFPRTAVDGDGKPVHRYPGSNEDDGAILQQIDQAESIRRHLMVSGIIEPARQTILSEHCVTDRWLEPLCVHSPFVPAGHEAVYARGFARFLQGDMIGAIHVLAPQLENSLRDVLRRHGHDVVKVNSDKTQEDVSLSAMLEKLRPAVDEIFGSALAADIDRMFNSRSGPNLRNRVAHGLMDAGSPWGADVIYGCWLILRVCCLPLFPVWDKVEAQYASVFGQ